MVEAFAFFFFILSVFCSNTAVFPPFWTAWLKATCYSLSLIRTKRTTVTNHASDTKAAVNPQSLLIILWRKVPFNLINQQTLHWLSHLKVNLNTKLKYLFFSTIKTINKHTRSSVNMIYSVFLCHWTALDPAEMILENDMYKYEDRKNKTKIQSTVHTRVFGEKHLVQGLKITTF